MQYQTVLRYFIMAGIHLNPTNDVQSLTLKQVGENPARAIITGAAVPNSQSNIHRDRGSGHNHVPTITAELDVVRRRFCLEAAPGAKRGQ